MSGLIATGSWSDDISWKLYHANEYPPEQICSAVMCVAIMDDKVVLARSKRGWGLLGGHIERGETIEQALWREALEEGGATIADYGLFAVREIAAKNPVHAPGRPHPYPFPVSAIVYHWAKVTTPLAMPSGEEILERRAFTKDELAQIETADIGLIDIGWGKLKTE